MRAQSPYGMRASVGLAMAVTVAWIGACSLVNGFDEFERVNADDPTDTTSSSSSSTTTSSSTTSSSTTSSSTTSSSTTSSSTTTGCDTGVGTEAACGDNMSGCIGCALNGPCAIQLADCAADMDCNA